MPMQPGGAAQADGAEIIKQRLYIPRGRTPAADAVWDEIRPGLLQDVADTVENDWRHSLASVRPLQPAYGDGGDVSTLSKFGLLDAQKRSGSTDLFGCNLHDRKLSFRMLPIKQFCIAGTAWPSFLNTNAPPSC